MSRKRQLQIAGGIIVASPIVWTLLASVAYMWLADVPFHCWFYYAVPWPDDWLWDRFYLVAAAALASFPFISAVQYLLRRKAQPSLYGKTGWADLKEMRQGGIKTIKDPL